LEKNLKIQLLDSQSQQNIVAFQSNSYTIVHMAVNDVAGERVYHV